MAGLSQDENSLYDIYDFIQVRSEQLNESAENALKILRINLIILGLFLPIVSNSLGGELDLEEIFNNELTQIGLVFWGLSTVTALITYFLAKRTSYGQFDPVEDNILGLVEDRDLIFELKKSTEVHTDQVYNSNILVTMCTILSLIAVGLLALGVLSPFVDMKLSTVALSAIISTIIIVVLAVIMDRIMSKGLDPRNIFSRNEKKWDDLNRQRKEALRNIYNRLYKETDKDSDEGFTLSEVAPSATASSGTSITLLRGDEVYEDTSVYILDRLVDDGYFEKQNGSSSKKIRSSSGVKISMDELDGRISEETDRLAKELEDSERVRRVAAECLGVRPDEILEELPKGSAIDQVERYNRISQGIDSANLDEDLHIGEFEFLDDEPSFKPTDLCEKAFEKIEKEILRDKRMEKEAKREEELRKSENTYNYLVINPVDEEDMIEVAPHDPSAKHNSPIYLYIPNSDLDDDGMEELRNLETDDEIRLRLERVRNTGEKYIAEIR